MHWKRLYSLKMPATWGRLSNSQPAAGSTEGQRMTPARPERCCQAPRIRTRILDPLIESHIGKTEPRTQRSRTRILDAPGDLGSTGAGHDHPVGIPFRRLELTAALVLEVEGMKVREE